jgi:hypothetical protein
MDRYQHINHWRAHVNAVMGLPFLLHSGKLLSGCTTDGLPNSAQFGIVNYVLIVILIKFRDFPSTRKIRFILYLLHPA